MHPDPGEFRLAGIGAALGDLVLVVREDQVDPAGMDVQHLAPNRRVSVPAPSRSTRGASRAGPGRRAHPRPRPPVHPPPSPPSTGRSPGRSPSRTRRLLTRPLAPVTQFPLIQLRQPAVGREPADREIDRAVLPLVGDALGPAGPGPGGSWRDEFGRPGIDVRRPHPEIVPVLEEGHAYGSTCCRSEVPRSERAAMVLSSTSVRFMMWKTSSPLASSHRRSRSSKRKVRKFPIWA